MERDEVLQWAPKVAQAARSVARDSPDSDYEDLQQAIWVALLTQQQKGKLLDIDAKHATSALYYAARQQAFSDRRVALARSCQYAYRTSDVRKLLKTFFEKDEWENAETPEDAVSELGNAGVEMSSDLSRAWDLMTYPHKVLIFCSFGLNEKVDSKKLSLAISRMCDIINTYKPGRREGLGSRTVMSNVQAGSTIEELTSGRPTSQVS